MKPSKITLILLILCLLGATNISQSTFHMEFRRGIVSTEMLVTDTLILLEQNGFHRTNNKIFIELQYGNSATWVIISSLAKGQLDLSFTQLHAGCGNTPEVNGAKEIVISLSKKLEARYGVITILETHQANQIEP